MNVSSYSLYLHFTALGNLIQPSGIPGKCSTLLKVETTPIFSSFKRHNAVYIPVIVDYPQAIIPNIQEIFFHPESIPIPHGKLCEEKGTSRWPAKSSGRFHMKKAGVGSGNTSNAKYIRKKNYTALNVAP